MTRHVPGSDPGVRSGQGTRVCPATPADTPALAALLARAFYNDPICCWLFPNPHSRARKLGRLFALFLDGLAVRGRVLTTVEREGAALWMLLPLTARDQVAQLWVGIRASLVLGRGMVRGVRLWLDVELRRPDCPQCYLSVLGVDPRHQGRGVGSALLHFLLEMCDAERLPVYLDAVRDNVPFYRRRGFEVFRTVALPDGPVVYQMVHAGSSAGRGEPFPDDINIQKEPLCQR